MRLSAALATAPPELPDADRKAAEGQLALAKTKLGELRFKVRPNGADILVDGQPVGRTPLDTPVYVIPGTVEVTARAEGFTGIRSQRIVAAGTVETFDLSLHRSGHYEPPAGSSSAERPPSDVFRGVNMPILISGGAASLAFVILGSSFAILSDLKSSSSHALEQPGAMCGSTCAAQFNDLQQAKVNFAGGALWSYIGASALLLGSAAYWTTMVLTTPKQLKAERDRGAQPRRRLLLLPVVTPMRRASSRTRIAAALAAVLILLVGLVTGCPFSAETFVEHCNTDTDCDDGNPCTDDSCTNTVCSNDVSPAHAACPTGVCDGTGMCVTCLSSADDAVCAKLHPGTPFCDGKTMTCQECLTYADCAMTHSTMPICDAMTQTCVSCTDGIKNGKETETDCGGPDCGACQAQPCDPMRGCGDMTVCAPTENICCNTSCTARCQACLHKNGAATDGTCGEVPLGEDPFGQCKMTGTVLAGGCGPGMGVCACQDGTKDLNETDVDCGGGTCPGCLTGQKCKLFSDCAAQMGETPQCANGICCEKLCNTGPCTACGPTGLCASVPAGSTDPNGFCHANQACGSGGTSCVGEAGTPCNPGAGGVDCLSGSCSLSKNTCNAGAPNKPCNVPMDCTSGNCQNNLCM